LKYPERGRKGVNLRVKKDVENLVEGGEKKKKTKPLLPKKKGG